MWKYQYISIATDVVTIDISNGFIPTNVITVGRGLCLWDFYRWLKNLIIYILALV